MDAALEDAAPEAAALDDASVDGTDTDCDATFATTLAFGLAFGGPAELLANDGSSSKTAVFDCFGAILVLEEAVDHAQCDAEKHQHNQPEELWHARKLEPKDGYG